MESWTHRHFPGETGRTVCSTVETNKKTTKVTYVFVGCFEESYQDVKDLDSTMQYKVFPLRINLLLLHKQGILRFLLLLTPTLAHTLRTSGVGVPTALILGADCQTKWSRVTSISTLFHLPQHHSCLFCTLWRAEGGC